MGWDDAFGWTAAVPADHRPARPGRGGLLRQRPARQLRRGLSGRQVVQGVDRYQQHRPAQQQALHGVGRGGLPDEPCRRRQPADLLRRHRALRLSGRLGEQYMAEAFPVTFDRVTAHIKANPGAEADRGRSPADGHRQSRHALRPCRTRRRHSALESPSGVSLLEHGAWMIASSRPTPRASGPTAISSCTLTGRGWSQIRVCRGGAHSGGSSTGSRALGVRG